MIHGKKIVDGSCLNYTPCACVELWPLVRSESCGMRLPPVYNGLGCTSWLQHLLSSSLSNHSLCSRVHSPYWPLFLLITERTSELEDASILMGNFSLFPFLLKYRNNAILGTEAT